MSFESLTDDEIQRLIGLPKRATNAVQAKVKQRPNTQHEECNIKLISDDGQESFTFYTRQNLKLKRDFSCWTYLEQPSRRSGVIASERWGTRPPTPRCRLSCP